MLRTAKGTLDNPGRNVKAKSGLKRAILAKGWHQFALALSSTARYIGTAVITVPAAYTSQRCSACGHVDPRSRESQAVFRCTHCAHTEHADVNAAKNILAAGLAVIACEDQPRPAGREGGRRSRNHIIRMLRLMSSCRSSSRKPAREPRRCGIGIVVDSAEAAAGPGRVWTTWGGKGLALSRCPVGRGGIRSARLSTPGRCRCHRPIRR